MELLEQFFNERGSAKSTKTHYTASVKHYTHLNKLSLEELLQEADNEEEQRIRWKNRKLKQRLINFRKYLYENMSEGSAKLYFNDIKTIYKHFMIEVLDLPKFNSRQIDKTYEMTYEDLITKEEIIDAYYEANNSVKNVIVFAMSSGYSKVDLLNLTVGDFIKACKKYITTNNLMDQLQELKNQTVIPTFKGVRQKTDKRFITFCSPEAVEHIVQELMGRDAQIREIFDAADDDEQEDLPEYLSYDDKLFDISESHLNYVVRKINNKLKFGKVGKYAKFRCHALRKFQASTLFNFKEMQWSIEEIDTLQGRSKDKTHRAYFHDDEDKLWEKYCRSVDELMLFKSIHQISDEEYKKVKAENNFYKNEIVKNEIKMEEQQRTIDKIISTQNELEKLLGLQ